MCDQKTLQVTKDHCEIAYTPSDSQKAFTAVVPAPLALRSSLFPLGLGGRASRGYAQQLIFLVSCPSHECFGFKHACVLVENIHLKMHRNDQHWPALHRYITFTYVLASMHGFVQHCLNDHTCAATSVQRHANNNAQMLPAAPGSNLHRGI